MSGSWVGTVIDGAMLGGFTVLVRRRHDSSPRGVTNASIRAERRGEPRIPPSPEGWLGVVRFGRVAKARLARVALGREHPFSNRLKLSRITPRAKLSQLDLGPA